jgi:hypothetical protein
MFLIYSQFKRSILFMLFLLSVCCTNQILAQCGPGQKFRTVEFPLGTSPGKFAFACSDAAVTVTKTDVGGPNFPSAVVHTAAASGASAIFTGPGGNTAPAYTFAGGGYSDYYIYDNGYTDVVYTFATPIVNPVLFVGGVGIDYGGSIEVVGKTITKIAGAGNFNVVGSTISAAFVPLAGFPAIADITSFDQRGHVSIAGTHSSITLRMKSLASPSAFQLYSISIGTCYLDPVPSFTPQAPVCTGEIWTATHWATEGEGYYTAAKPGLAQLRNGNAISIVKNDVSGVSVLAPSSVGGDTYNSAPWNSFPNTAPASVKGGGYLNISNTGETEVTYTFCKPETDAYVFFGFAGILPGSSVEFDKAFTLMDANGLIEAPAKTVAVCGGNPALFKNGYLKINGTQTSFKMKFKGVQLFTIMVGTCYTLPAKAANPFTCAAGSTETNVNFTNSAAATGNAGFASAYTTTGTKGPFKLIDNVLTDVNNAKGAPVKVTITTANPSADLCGLFSADPLYAGVSLVGQYQTTWVKKAGDGFSYKYVFNSPVKVKLRNISANAGVVHNEVLTFEAKNGATPVNVSATATGLPINGGLITAMPGNPQGTMITGAIGGSLWNAWTDAEVTEITFNYKSNSGDVWRQETHELIICSAPCAPQYPVGCAPANQRTEAFGFARTSATAATGSKGANNMTMTTTAGIPILAAAGSGASAMSECGDANKQMSVSSGGWALLGMKANKTGEKITLNFTQPVKDPIILLWNIYSTTKVDVAGITSCLQPIRTWGGAKTVATSMTGTPGLAGIGYWQIPGTYTSLEFDVTTGIFEDWVYFSVGEGACSPTPEVVNATTPRAITCSSPTGSLRTYDANFDIITSAYKTVTGKTYNAVANPALPTVGYVNDVTVDCSTNNGYFFGLYGLTSLPAGQVSAEAGCAPATADFASAGGGAVYAYSGVGTQGTAPWASPGNMKWTLKNEVVNPIIKVKYLSWTKLTFKDCDGNIIPIATIPGTFKGGLSAAGSSLFTNGTGITTAPLDNSEWADGLEGEGAVQLIGRFKEINISVEKTGIWLDYWSMTLSEQVCIDPATIVRACESVLPSPCSAPGTQLTVKTSTLTKTSALTAVGSVEVGKQPVTMTVATTAEVLSATTNRAATHFSNPACYNITAGSGGYVTFRDLGGNRLTTLNFGLAVTNPLIYVKDLVRAQLNFGNTLDAYGNTACCLKLVSGCNGLTVNGLIVSDSNPTDNGSPSQAILQAGGIIQLIGTFRTITINSSRPSDSRFDNWSLAVSADPATCEAIPTPTPVQILKRVVSVVPKDPANPAGNQIITFEVSALNLGTQKLENLFLSDKLDEKLVPGAVVAVTAAPYLDWTTGIQAPNPAFNGKDISDLLLPEPFNNTLKAGEAVRVRYSIEMNPSLIPANARHNNSVEGGSTSMPTVSKSSSIPGAPVSYDEIAVPLYLPKSVGVPKDVEMSICGGGAPSAFAAFVQGIGGATVIPNASCGTIKWSWTWVTTVLCGTTELRKVTFRGFDDCGTNYEFLANFKTTDDCPPIFDMLPMDKTVVCADPDATASINMWLASVGGAWFGDPGVVKGTGPALKATNDYNQTGCNPGVYLVKFTVSDGCGNKNTASATLTILATSTITYTPTTSNITLAANLDNKNLTCKDILSFDKPAAVTTCIDGIASTTFVDAKTNGKCVNEYTVTRTWKIEDNCGTKFKTTQSLSVTDNDAPIFDKNLAKTLTMTKTIFPVWKKVYFGSIVKATDNCSKVKVSAPTIKSLNANSVECTVSATDDCGNVAFHTCIVDFKSPSTVSTLTKTAKGNSDITANELEDMIQSDIDVKTEALIYPNPTESIVNIIPAKGYGALSKVRIYSITGQILLNMDVENQTSEQVSIDISSFKAGNYIIEMEYSDAKLYSRVQKIN